MTSDTEATAMDVQTTRIEDIEGWAELDTAQRDQLGRTAEQVRALHPGDEPLQHVALAAVVRYWRGTLTLEDAGAQLSQARRAEAEARAVARQLGILAVGDGGSVLGTANTLGIDRQALLKWLGKK
jgi:hypothetical protein